MEENIIVKKKRIPWNKGKKDTRKYIYYTDGKINLRVLEGTPCPEGFHRGRIKRELTPEELKVAKEKQKQTCLKKYGYEYAFQAEEIKEKIKQSNLEKYGVEYSWQREDVKEKIKQTSLDRYGTEYPVQSEESKEKTKQTCLKKYGVDNYAKTDECKEKYKKTCRKKFNVDNARLAPEVIAKIKAIEKESIEKCIKTKKINHSFNTSSPEEAYYIKLVETYGIENVIRQYSDERYPFMCDFYIKSLDLFIELNLHWTHGYHKFDTNNQEDLAKLIKWQEKAKTSDFYKNAIKVWTIKDIKKYEYAKKNNLNYKVYYYESELNI